MGIAIGADTEAAAEAADVMLARNAPRDVVAIPALARTILARMARKPAWATSYDVMAIPLAVGLGAPWGMLPTAAIGAPPMSPSTIVGAINARLPGRYGQQRLAGLRTGAASAP